jgi:hypothetical protein
VDEGSRRQPDAVGEAGPSGRPIRPVGRAVALYTSLRILLFLVVFLLLQLVMTEPLLALGAAVLISAALSIPLLRPWREDLARSSAAKAERRRLAQAEQRARLDEG